MSHSFQFKQFAVRHDRCTHKVGTDAVLLGAWTDVSNATRILDIGAGSGIIALMLAQRTNENVFIEAVEPGQNDFLQARENIENSPWAGRIKLHSASIQEFQSDGKYDLIVSNPPFFSNSLAPPSPLRQQTRHTVSLSPADLLRGVQQRLSDSGRFSVILPTAEGRHFQSMAGGVGLFCLRELAFFSRKEKPQERMLMEWSTSPATKISETLVLHGQGDQWSDAYKKLTADFYLDR